MPDVPSINGIPLVTLSNWGHWVEGAIAVAVAIFSIGGLAGIDDARTRWLPGALTIVAGLLLGPVLLLHHGLHVAWVMLTDPQQAQHVLMGFLLIAGGAAALVARAARRPRVAIGLGIANAGIGILFLFHAQHGTDHAVHVAMLIHRGLGIAFLLCAASQIAWAWSGAPRWGWAANASLLAIGLLLIAYREPPGAFMGHHGTPAWVDAIDAEDAAAARGDAK